MPAVNIQLAARKYDLPADAGERALASDTLHTSADRSGTGASTPSSPLPLPAQSSKARRRLYTPAGPFSDFKNCLHKVCLIVDGFLICFLRMLQIKLMRHDTFYLSAAIAFA